MGSDTTGPEPLAFAVTPHLVHASRDMACWFTHPPGIVIQVVRAVQGTRSMTDWLGGLVQSTLLARFPGVNDLIVVVDLSRMAGREPGARNGLVEPAKRLKAHVGRTVLLPPASVSRVYLGSLYAATALLSAVGIHVEIRHSLREVISDYGLRPAER